MHDQPRILAVDDDKLIRLNLALALGREGFHVDTAATCDEARILLGTNHYQVVLTDLDLPDENGLEVLRAARARAPGVKVIVVTGSTSSGDLSEMKIDGAEAVIVKPFAMCDIVDDVKRALGWPSGRGGSWPAAATAQELPVALRTSAEAEIDPPWPGRTRE